MKAIILISEASLPLAKTLQRELPDTLIYTKNECEGCISITSCHRFIEEHFNDFDSIIFIGAMGICVRSIAGCIKNKYKDPAVVCVDSTGRFVISVLSGHVGGANELTRHIAAITGGEAVITTQSDNAGLWALDTLAGKYPLHSPQFSTKNALHGHTYTHAGWKIWLENNCSSCKNEQTGHTFCQPGTNGAAARYKG